MSESVVSIAFLAIPLAFLAFIGWLAIKSLSRPDEVMLKLIEERVKLLEQIAKERQQ